MISGAIRRQFRAPGALGRRSVSQVLAEPTAWNQPGAVVTTLPNGVRVVSKQTYGETTSVGLFVNAGVRDETVATRGASKLVEKLALTGTQKRPKAQLEKEVEALGAELSATVGREQTAFTMALPGADVKQGVDILSDLVTSPGLGNLAREKEGILRALEEADQPNRTVLDDRLHQCAFRDCALGFSAVGPFDGIETLSEDAVKSYVGANYTADRIVLAAVGPGKHEDLAKAAAASTLGGVKAGSSGQGSNRPYFCGAELIYRNDEMGALAYVSVGWEGVPWRSPDALTFMVMEKIIGSYKKGAGLVPGTISGNRTINAIANKMGVGCAEEFEAFNIHYRDTGMFGFYAVCDEVAVEHCIGELMFGINLLSFAVTEEEVARGKRELKAALYGSTAASSECAALGKEMLGYGRSIPAAEMLLRIDAIDAEEVKRVAYKYLNDQEVSVTALGPLHGMPQYFDVRRATCMHRY
eukprot:TRINITY_DN151_c0_g1_i5.p1 TRINITY_DN151_c0_g1~~TRINITY_DN151_c0_g1_i5.p1  ORF type:complete len:497 (-),score=119.01 TRINITY_DN151_c0_g1_i5:85-1494(-)